MDLVFFKSNNDNENISWLFHFTQINLGSFHDVRVLCCFPDFWSRFSLTSVLKCNLIWLKRKIESIKYHYDSQKYYISVFGIKLFDPMSCAKYSKNRIKCCDNFTGKYLSKIRKKKLLLRHFLIKTLLDSNFYILSDISYIFCILILYFVW